MVYVIETYVHPDVKVYSQFPLGDGYALSINRASCTFRQELNG